jgi:hypothetical protein
VPLTPHTRRILIISFNNIKRKRLGLYSSCRTWRNLNSIPQTYSSCDTRANFFTTTTESMLLTNITDKNTVRINRFNATTVWSTEIPNYIITITAAIHSAVIETGANFHNRHSRSSPCIVKPCSLLGACFTNNAVCARVHSVTLRIQLPYPCSTFPSDNKQLATSEWKYIAIFSGNRRYTVPWNWMRLIRGRLKANNTKLHATCRSFDEHH